MLTEHIGRITHMARRPLCPYCEDDLSGTYDRFSREAMRCSECGETFEVAEVEWSRRPGEWTLQRGLAWMGVSLLWRISAAVIILSLGAISIEAFGAWLAGQSSSGFFLSARVYFLPACAIGVIAGLTLMRGLQETAGFESWLIAFVAAGGMVIAMIIARQVSYRVIVPSYIDIELYLFLTTAPAVATVFVWHFYEHGS